MGLPPYDRWPFVGRALYDPIRALDLLDRHAVPDHTKIVPFLVLIGIFTLKLLHIPITVMEMTVLLTAAFGHACWRMFLRQKLLTGTDTATSSTTSSTTSTHIVNETVQRQILERRDADLGIDPTHE